MIINRCVNFRNINEIRLFDHFFLNVLRVNVIFYLFKMFFEKFISKLFSFDLFLTINLKNRVIINEIIDKNEKFFDVDILLLLCSHRSKINNILFLNMSKTISYLFIYNFSRIKSCYFN